MELKRESFASNWIDEEREKLTQMQELLARIGYKQATVELMKKDGEPTKDKQKDINTLKRKYSALKRTL